MARQLRISYPNALYHITCRGNKRGGGRENIFFSDEDRNRFLEIIERTQDRYHYLLHAYVLMDNHFHFLIETPLANIQAVMHNINTSYTVYINRKNDRWGHLFQGRYKSIIVDKDNYLLALSRYTHLNPVRASMVSYPENYSWSSYCCYIGRAAVPPYLHTVTASSSATACRRWAGEARSSKSKICRLFGGLKPQSTLRNYFRDAHDPAHDLAEQSAPVCVCLWLKPYFLMI